MRAVVSRVEDGGLVCDALLLQHGHQPPNLHVPHRQRTQVIGVAVIRVACSVKRTKRTPSFCLSSPLRLSRACLGNSSFVTVARKMVETKSGISLTSVGPRGGIHVPEHRHGRVRLVDRVEANVRQPRVRCGDLLAQEDFEAIEEEGRVIAGDFHRRGESGDAARVGGVRVEVVSARIAPVTLKAAADDAMVTQRHNVVVAAVGLAPRVGVVLVEAACGQMARFA